MAFEWAEIDYTPPDVVQNQDATVYQTPETKVAKQMETLLQSDSPLLKIADTRAREEANQLGLLSSSMAVGAGQREAMKQMLPIAQQDAQSATQFGVQQQQGDTQSVAQQNQGSVQSALASQQGGVTSQLQDQKAAETEQLANVQYTLNKDLQLLDQDFKTYLGQLDVTQKEKANLTQYATGLADRMMTEIANLQRDPSVNETAKNIAIANLQGLYKSQLQTLSSLYNVELTWADPNLTPFSESGAETTQPLSGWLGILQSAPSEEVFQA